MLVELLDADESQLGEPLERALGERRDGLVGDEAAHRYQRVVRQQQPHELVVGGRGERGLGEELL